ncbi:DUF397 domain-containing protein [Amycolatopsis sp. H20-H5]|uniref:DUF397 domain-containing protein n=1 Tax=Amycolatopsis sp. H20-H5 TaxID=3046309 RepID=UPI002DB6866D|nr:DUF397 domain-containing protein [Amycolatopsis sp. H20-H5]MEC3974720.1 DUF397 domain-containing protein [Amycolatopsis sp. H20-H5]
MNAELKNAHWRKSSRSSGGSNNCVEVALATKTVGVRDTKDRAAGHLAVSPGAWGAFLAKVSAN